MSTCKHWNTVYWDFEDKDVIGQKVLGNFLEQRSSDCKKKNVFSMVVFVRSIHRQCFITVLTWGLHNIKRITCCLLIKYKSFSLANCIGVIEIKLYVRPITAHCVMFYSLFIISSGKSLPINQSHWPIGFMQIIFTLEVICLNNQCDFHNQKTNKSQNVNIIYTQFTLTWTS